MEIVRVSMEMLNEDDLREINDRIAGLERPRVQLTIDVTDTANSYEEKTGRSSRRRTLTAFCRLNDNEDKRTQLMRLQRSIYDQNFVYSVSSTNMTLQFFEDAEDVDLSEVSI